MLKFTNQTRALEFFERHLYNDEPFFYLVEPAQMGKSSLIREVIDYCALKRFPPFTGEAADYKPDSWWTIRVDLSISKNNSPLTLAGIHSSILAAMGARGPATATSILNHLIEGMNRERKRAILLFDGSEYLSDEIAVALWNLFDMFLDTFEPTPHYRPAALIAGRCTFAAWETYYHPKMKRVELSPFASTDLIGILKDARKCAAPWEQREYLEYAGKVFESSMGHPGCTSEIILHLSSGNFVERYPHSRDYFLKVVVPFIQKRILTGDHLANHKRFRKADQELLSQILLELSTYRIIIPTWIEVAAHRIDSNISLEKLQKLESQIENCPLVTHDYSIHGWSVLSPSIRRLLERWLTVERNDREQRHQEAAEQYEKWLDIHEESAARKSPAMEDSLALLIELLFHLTLSSKLQSTPFVNYLLSHLQKNIVNLSPWFPGQRITKMIETRLADDSELHALIVERAAEQGFRMLQGKISSFSKETGGI